MPGRVESSCSSSLVDESGEDFPNRNNAMVFLMLTEKQEQENGD